MRKLAALTVAIAALASIALAPTAGARDIPVTLNLVAHITGGHRVHQHRFEVTGDLYKAGSPVHKKGHLKVIFNRHNTARGVLYLRNGKIKFQGQGRKNLVIVGGTRHWDGVTGHAQAKNEGRNTFRLKVFVES